MTPWGIYPGRKILALTWGLLVPSAKRFEKRYFGRWLAAKEMLALIKVHIRIR
jgi:hypothetical protein